MKDAPAAAVLDELRREYGLMADRAASVNAIAGRDIDLDPAVNYWNFDSADLENEMWNRLPELEAGLDIMPDCTWPGRIRGRIKQWMMRLALPLIHRSLEKQDRLNRRSKDMYFIQFLALKQLHQLARSLETENRKLSSRLDAIEVLLAASEPARHE